MAGILALLAVMATVAYFGADVAGTKEAGAPADPAGVPDGEPVARVAAQVAPSVVQVNVQAVQETPFGAQEGEGVGSGVIYRRDGFVITNNHVVQGASEVNIAFADGTTEQGEVVGTDPATDLAVVRVDRRGLPAASFRESADLVVGQLAVAIGSPSGFQSTVTSGVISGLSRDLPPELTRGDTSLVDLIQTDAAISPGSSGGALVDRAGEVVGVNVAYLPPAETGAANIGFAIPSDTAITVADQLIETGRATQPYLGIGLEEITPEDAERFDVPGGVLVTNVEGGGPSDEAGLQRGDVITAAGSVETASYGDLLGALRDYRPGDTINLSVVRDGDERDIEVELGERPQQ
jgi:S1-C subfamily serine protease